MIGLISRTWRCTAVLGILALACCESTKTGEEAGKEGEDSKTEPAPGGMDLSMLLSMSYQEAAALSPQRMELPPFFKVAADQIEVTHRTKDGAPRKLKATGKVFLQMNYRESAVALCQEALIGDDEVILRGKPVLQRGGSVVEGLDDSTVFYMLGTKLRVIGLHKLTNHGEIAAMEVPTLGPWEQGPNPLLPPLTPSVVPDSIRREMQKAAEAEMLLQQNRRDAGAAKMREPAGEKPPKEATEKAATDKAATDKAATDKAPTDKPATEKTAPDKAASGTGDKKE